MTLLAALMIGICAGIISVVKLADYDIRDWRCLTASSVLALAAFGATLWIGGYPQ